MNQNPSLETALIFLFLLSLTLLFILATAELVAIQKQSGASLRDEDPELNDYFRP